MVMIALAVRKRTSHVEETDRGEEAMKGDARVDISMRGLECSFGRLS